MIGIGTLINTISVIIGGLIGFLFGKLIKEKVQDALTKVCGISVIFIGTAGALAGMFTVNDGVITAGKSMMLTICLALGTFLGEIIGIEDLFEKFGIWLKKKTHSESDGKFVDAFVTTSLTVCIGAMAIVGSIEDGIKGDFSVLAVKSILDFIIVMIMTSSMGKGSVFSAIPIFVIEGGMTLLAVLIKPLMTDLALQYISIVGAVMIFCVGVNLVFDKKVRVANMLPALLLAAAASYLPFDF